MQLSRIGYPYSAKGAVLFQWQQEKPNFRSSGESGNTHWLLELNDVLGKINTPLIVRS